MSVNSLYGSTPIRFGGIATGLDTETIIKDLMCIEQMKVEKLYQEKTRTEWLREDYRRIINKLKDFKDTRFDVLKPSTYMLSSNTYRAFKVTSTNTDFVEVSARSGASTGTTTIEWIESLATSAYLTTGSATPDSVDDYVSAPLSSTTRLGEHGLQLEGEKLTLALDGVSRTITFSSNYAGLDETESFEGEFQALLDSAFGENRIKVEVAGDGSIELTALNNSTIAVTGGTVNALSDLQLSAGMSSRANLDAAIANAGLNKTVSFGTGGKLVFEINGVPFEFNSSTTLREIMSEINNSDAGVTLSYSSLTDSFTLKANATGAGKTIEIVNKEGNFFGSDSVIGITQSEADNGTDAKLSINNTVIFRSTNNFTIDGLNYNLKAVYNGDPAINVTTEYDVSSVVDNIKGFVEQYNEVIDTIHKKLSEERFRDFYPLTEEQKAEMKEKEIELWEGKARSGLLRGDRLLESMVLEMRRALADAVEGVGLSLSSIGIKTGSYTEKGRLVIDEKALTDALRNHGDKVERLFAAQSEISYSPNLTSTERAQRYKESGLMHRISDILNNYIRTTRDSDGKKGILLEKAGITNDVTEYQNMLNDKIKSIDWRIENAMRLLQSKEESYWRQFTAMEKAIQQMNAQSAWLMQQMGNSNY